MPTSSKGRPFDQGYANQIYSELLEQARVIGIKHTASFSNNPGVILADAAEQLASYGVATLYNLAERTWTELEEQTDPSNPDGQPITVEVTHREVYDKTTGQVLPLRELNNAAGGGFTWYAIQFAGEVPIVVAWKEATGLDAFAAQVGSILNLPPVRALILAFSVFSPIPGGLSYMAAWTNSIGTAALTSVGINAAAYPLLTKMVGSVAISTIQSGGNLSAAVQNLAVNEVAQLVGGAIGGAVDSQTVGKVATAVAKAELTGGQIPLAVAADLGIDVLTEGVRAVSDYTFGDNNYSLFPEDSFAFGQGLKVPTDASLGLDVEMFDASDLVYDYEIYKAPDNTMIGIRVDGTVLAETTDGKTYDVTSIWDDLPSLDDLNKTLKGLTQLAVTGTTLTNIIEGKPATGTRPAPGTVQTLADGSTVTYNANGTVTRRLPNGQVISSTSQASSTAAMQNLTPLLAIGGIGLLLAS